VLLDARRLRLATDDNRTGTINSELTYRVRTSGTRVLRLGSVQHTAIRFGELELVPPKLTVKRVVGPTARSFLSPTATMRSSSRSRPPAAPNADVTLRFETGGDVFVDMAWRHTDNYFTLATPTGIPRRAGPESSSRST
jgi:hypothetical protein